jgi:hypothetical protein
MRYAPAGMFRRGAGGPSPKIIVLLPCRLILSDDEELTEAGAIPEAATQEEPEAEGANNVEVVAYSSPSSPLSSSSETEESTPSAPHCGGKGLMGLGGLLDVKAIAPEALRPAAFEPSAREVGEIFGTFVLPELEIPLTQKSTNELLDASDVVIAKVYCLFSYIILLDILLTCVEHCRLCFYHELSASRLRNLKAEPGAHTRRLTCYKNGHTKLKAKSASCHAERRMLNCNWNSLKKSLAPFARRSRLPRAK